MGSSAELEKAGRDRSVAERIARSSPSVLAMSAISGNPLVVVAGVAAHSAAVLNMVDKMIKFQDLEKK